MPYNSSSFEKQLAKYKIAQAEKSVADMPRKKYETYSDPHQIKPHVNAERGSIKSYAKDPLQLMGEGAQTTPVITQRDQGIVPIIIQKRKKAWYKRTWFVIFVITTLPMLGAPIFYKEEIAQIRDVAGTVKTTTGVDPFALKTYTGMIKGKVAGTPPATATMLPSGATTDQAASQTAPAIIEKNEPMDMTNAVEKAQEKAESVTSKGAGYSMQYIEEETKRLNEAAKQFDEQYKK